MVVVGLKLGQGPSGALAEAFRKAGFSLSTEGADVEVRAADPPESEDPGPVIEACLRGKRLLLCGGFGALSAAAHLGPAGDRVEGHAAAAVRGLPHLEHVAATPVTGVGYALYRIGTACVALGGPRGDGWIAYLGDPSPDPSLATATLMWLVKIRNQVRFFHE